MKFSQKGTLQTSGSGKAVSAVRYDVKLLTDQDLRLFDEGSHYRLYQKLGGSSPAGRRSRRNLLRRLGSER